jgi:hypothetical protein
MSEKEKVIIKESNEGYGCAAMVFALGFVVALCIWAAQGFPAFWR